MGKGGGGRGAGNDFLQDRATCGCRDPEAGFPGCHEKDTVGSLVLTGETPTHRRAGWSLRESVGRVFSGRLLLVKRKPVPSPQACCSLAAHSPSSSAPTPFAQVENMAPPHPILFILLALISFPSDSSMAVEAPGCRLPHFESWSCV